ncbi:MAG: hypothetical protein HYY18_14010 [Planctomycetes bacterium]|nr:hypothetical protein [Planctomycetota bacterium]
MTNPTSNPEPIPLVPWAPRAAALAAWFASAASLLGLLGIAGWIFDIDSLKGVLPGLATMKANTALAILLEGAALAVLAASPRAMWTRTAARAAAAAGGAVGALTLLEFATGANLGIDELLVRDVARNALPYYAGRMAPTTALNFVLLAVAIGLVEARRPRIGRACEGSAIAALVIAFMSLAGYLYGVSPEGPVAVHTTQMAVHTSTAFVLISAAVLLARTQHGLLALVHADDVGGFAARRLLPVAIGVPLAAGAFFLAGRNAAWYGAEFTVAALVVATVVVLSAVILMSSALLGKLDAERRLADAATRRLNAELERRVSERTAELAAANRELEAFASSISHDLSGPVQTVDGFAAALQQECGPALGDAGLDHVRRIRAAAQHMGLLMEALLELSRLTRAEMKRETVDLSALAGSIAAELAGREPGRAVEFRIAPGLFARGDPRLLRILLENLLGNAWKFTSRAPHPVVEFASGEDDGRRAFVVRDNGAGFDMSQVDRLFSPFHRLHTPAEFPGHGVGLATVQRIVQRHGGRIRGKGERGKGAEFRFTLEGEEKKEL